MGFLTIFFTDWIIKIYSSNKQFENLLSLDVQKNVTVSIFEFNIF